MIRDVRVARDVSSRAHDRFGEGRSVEGAPSEYDFVGGPLAAAILAFRDFENLAYVLVSTVRTYTIVDPFFGAVSGRDSELPRGPTSGSRRYQRRMSLRSGTVDSFLSGMS